jgi:hypothetical protein
MSSWKTAYRSFYYAKSVRITRARACPVAPQLPSRGVCADISKRVRRWLTGAMCGMCSAEEPDDIHLDPATTALLCIDIQKTYMEPQDTPEENERWAPFCKSCSALLCWSCVIPNNRHHQCCRFALQTNE